MIFEETNTIAGVTYNRKLIPSDWRYSAAALGMIRFFRFHGIPHRHEKRNLYYNFEDITTIEEDEKYLEFAEDYFSDYFHHVAVKELLKREANENNIKFVNEKLSANTVMKNVFKGIKYDGSNGQEILNILDSNRLLIIRETFINGKKTYRKFINSSKFRSKKGDVCRLLGYYVDTGRKLKSLGFGFDKNARTYCDEEEFDYIPFAFSKGVESIFINSNIGINSIVKANTGFVSKLENHDEWRNYFYDYKKSSEFIAADIELIQKGMETDGDKNDYYSSIYLRRQAIDIFREIDERNDREHILNALKISIKINDNYYISLAREVTDSIINLWDLDNLIDLLLKRGKSSFVLAMLIRINVIIYSKLNRLEGNMDNEKYLKAGVATALSIVEKFKKAGNINKIKSYRHKLTSALVANDYDRFIEIMLQLSSYTETPFTFMHELIKDFQSNKNLAYAFVNALIENEYNKEEGKDNNSGGKNND